MTTLFLRIFTVLLILISSTIAAADPIHIVVSGAEEESLILRYRQLGVEKKQTLTKEDEHQVAKFSERCAVYSASICFKVY